MAAWTACDWHRGTPRETATFIGGHLLLGIALTVLIPGFAIGQPVTTRVNIGSGGAEANGPSSVPVISSDGRWVAFFSSASNLVGDDTNGVSDVFVHDRQTATTSRTSLGLGGTNANGHSSAPVISADGRLVAFQSDANNLVVGDTNGTWDVFVHDRQLGTTTRVSVSSAATEGNGRSVSPHMSADGRWVAFESDARDLVVGDTNGATDVFLHDRQTGTTTRVSVGVGGVEANGESVFSTISPSGRWVGFSSYASNLVAGDTNGYQDIFVYDNQLGTTTRVSVATGGAQPNHRSFASAISSDGRWVAFDSYASNLVAGDTNGTHDVFLHDRQTGTTTRLSVGSGGVQGNNASQFPALSADSRFVVFHSSASNLVAGDTNGQPDIFRRDLLAGVTTRESVATGGAQANDYSYRPAISADGHWITFYSNASNLVAGDLNGRPDIFVRGEVPGPAPMPPAALRVHALTGNALSLRWLLPPGGVAPSGFVLEGGVNPGEVLASLATGRADPTFTFTAPPGSFYIRVHALNGAIRSAASNEIRIHVNVPVAPSAPANLLGLVNGSTLALAWTNTYLGGAPSSLVLDVTGAITTSLPFALTDSVSFAGVPAGTYTLALRAQNAGGSSPPSNSVTLTFPGPCTGPPLMPEHLFAYRVGNSVFVDWAPAASGPAPTGYVLNVTGSFVGSFATAARAMSGTVGPGSYTLSVVATNPCGVSAATAPQTVVVQ